MIPFVAVKYLKKEMKIKQKEIYENNKDNYRNYELTGDILQMNKNIIVIDD
jgi:hypothetical protein